MDRAFRTIVAAVLATGGCSDGVSRPRLTPDELLTKLRELPGVTAAEAPTKQVDFHYYILHFTQPIDHEDPSLGTFQQKVSLLHRNEQDPVPMIIHTSGYDDYYRDHPVELTKLLAANQVSIEHRYFGESRPEVPDWTKLTIAQMAADEHAIIDALRGIYEGAFLSTGGSKGGMTAVFHRRFYPSDVEGTVAFVAPISFGTPDPRYPPFVDEIGPRGCHEAVREVARLMLEDRRHALEDRARLQAEGEGHLYTRVEIGPAVEAAIVGLEWTFWQFFGVNSCSKVPKINEDEAPPSDEALFAFLDMVSPVTDNDDEQVERFAPYYYQSYAQLGYPDYGAAYLRPFLYYSELDYVLELPTLEEPPYDDRAMRDINDYVEDHGSRMLFIYGEWDPWTAGKFAIGQAEDSAVYTQKHGNHRSGIAGLDMHDREDALGRLRRWTGVDPLLSRLRGGESGTARSMTQPPQRLGPRMPPALVRALRGRQLLASLADQAL